MEENKIQEYYSNVISKVTKDTNEHSSYSLRIIQDAISDFTKERNQVNLHSYSAQILLARYIFDRLQKQ